jgi:hypothetical protein
MVPHFNTQCRWPPSQKLGTLFRMDEARGSMDFAIRALLCPGFSPVHVPRGFPIRYQVSNVYYVTMGLWKASGTRQSSPIESQLYPGLVRHNREWQSDLRRRGQSSIRSKIPPLYECSDERLVSQFFPVKWVLRFISASNEREPSLFADWSTRSLYATLIMHLPIRLSHVQISVNFREQ